MPSSRRVNVLGVGFSAVGLEQAVETVERWVETQSPSYVCVSNTHVVMEAQRDPALRRTLNRSGLTVADGRPVMWTARLLGERELEHIRGADLTLALCASSEVTGSRHFLYGGAEGVADEAAEALVRRFPRMVIAGTYSPPFRTLTPEEDEAACAMLRASRADIVWVGLGAPKQELWMSEHVGRVGASVLAGVGAVFDFLSGRKPEAPAWMQRTGCEWAFRMATDRRLWRRYASNNPRYALAACLQVLGLRSPEPLDEDAGQPGPPTSDGASA